MADSGVGASTTDDVVVSKKNPKPSTGLMDYLKSLSPAQLHALYAAEDRGRFVCRAVLQRLSSLAQQVVVRLSCTGGTFPLSGVHVWIKKNSQAILKELSKWAIVNLDANQITLVPEFQKGLQESLIELDASPWKSLKKAQVQSLEKEANEPHIAPVSLEDLERYTQTQWDAVLHFLVGTVGHVEPPAAVVHFLMQTGLMQPDPDFVGNEDDAPLVITQKGYDFMLQDSYRQVWHFVLQYLFSLESHKKGKELMQEALLLLISLSFARMGEAYLASSLTKDGRVMVKDLALFGLLYTRKIGKQTVFYPTRVAMQLVGREQSDVAAVQWSLSSKALEEALAHPTPQDSSHLAIIVQTNFQLCAYTTSELHVSMLGLFCDVQTIRRLPNIVFMAITRDSVKSAFALGIQANQILRFLEKHAHPRLRTTGASTIPANVVDQILLWNLERSRVKFTQVYEHRCILQGEFAAVLQYSKDRNAYAWSNERRQQVLIDYKHVERVESFARQWRSQAAVRPSLED